VCAYLIRVFIVEIGGDLPCGFGRQSPQWRTFQEIRKFWSCHCRFLRFARFSVVDKPHETSAGIGALSLKLSELKYA